DEELKGRARISRDLEGMGPGLSIAQATQLLIAAKSHGRLLEAWNLLQGHLEQADRRDDFFSVLEALKREGVNDLNEELLPISQREFTSDELRGYLRSTIPKAREAAELELLARGVPAVEQPGSSLAGAGSSPTGSLPSAARSLAPRSLAPRSRALVFREGFDWVRPVTLLLVAGLAAALLIVLFWSRQNETADKAAAAGEVPGPGVPADALHREGMALFTQFGEELDSGRCAVAWQTLTRLTSMSLPHKMIEREVNRRFAEACPDGPETRSQPGEAPGPGEILGAPNAGPAGAGAGAGGASAVSN
ncbi:MAG: hypothetical protein RJA70_4992, partial [Pseudomonadota bacterium]